MLIVIVGPDGCGKTTVANSLVDYFKSRNKKLNHFAMHFNILPPLKKFINPFLKKKIDDTHIEGQLLSGMNLKPSPPLLGMIYVFWYGLDYFLGHFKLIFFRMFDQHVIFARYFYDYYYQRGHVNTPIWFINFIEIFIPKPDYIFTIYRSPENIFKLKPELSINEIKVQQIKIDKYILQNKNAFKIDGTKGQIHTTSEILKILNNQIDI
jgi:thymidylate kinase